MKTDQQLKAVVYVMVVLAMMAIGQLAILLVLMR